ncbi:Hypothetical predicted protein [Mytilus galloprovincialis]|uniref:Uncharacterized protein n=1 Tax=Mytilus galloprovincialis TaxID=29158 RepID=A0A8B6BQQ8_MYTGA|nr:Hypothetical predicted protein [Mytilus galloprovincialis]
MLNEGMDAVDIQDISTSPQCIQSTVNEHGYQEDFETLGDRIKRIFKNILCWNKPELTTNLKVEVSEQDHFQVRVETDKTKNEVNVFVSIPRYFHFQRFESSEAAKCFDAIIFRDLLNPKTINTSGSIEIRNQLSEYSKNEVIATKQPLKNTFNDNVWIEELK